MTQSTHDDKAATRGNPSFVWRAGQDRRLDMMRRFTPLVGQRVLDIGCGIGTYTRKFVECGAQAFGVDIEGEYLRQSSLKTLAFAVTERLPFADDSFDMALLHEVIEHVVDDRQTVADAVRVVKPGGRVLIFAPNRLWPFETHGFYWRGQYHFGNIPFIPYLPNSLRNRLAPHVRTYTWGSIRALAAEAPCRIIAHTQIYPGYDNVIRRRPTLGKALRALTYAMESTPLRIFGLSHLLVVEKTKL